MLTGEAALDSDLDVRKSRSDPVRWMICCLIIAFIPTVFFFAQLARPGGLLNLFQFGIEFEQSTVPAVASLHPPRNFRHGYDAQFSAQLAMDPFLRDPQTIAAIDYPGYRARRMAMPVVSHFLGFGNPALTLNILASLNYVFFLGLLVAVVLVIKPTSVTQWAAVAAAVLTTGCMDSLQRSLSDLPAATLIFVAVTFPLGALGVVLLAIAILTREISVISAVPCAIGRPLFAWNNFLRLAGVLLPGAVLVIYLFIHVPGWGSGPEGNFQLPGSAMLQRFVVSWADFLEKPNDRRLFMLLTPICLIVQAVYFWRYRRFDSALWWSGIGFTVLLFIIGEQMWVGSLAAPRVVLPMTIAFNVLLAKQLPPRFWIWFVAGNAGLLWGLRKLTIDVAALWL